MPPLNSDKVLEQVASLKGLFKGKGELQRLSGACATVREELIQQTLPATLVRARISPLHLLPVHLSRQSTTAGTVFLRWRRVDRSAMGVAQWQALLLAPQTPAAMVPTLYELERRRILFNAQISLIHTLAQLAQTTLNKLTYAECIHQQRVSARTPEDS